MSISKKEAHTTAAMKRPLIIQIKYRYAAGGFRKKNSLE